MISSEFGRDASAAQLDSPENLTSSQRPPSIANEKRNNKEAFIADRDELFYEDGEDGLGWCVNGIGEDGELEPWPIHLVVEEIAETEQAEEVEVFLRV